MIFLKTNIFLILSVILLGIEIEIIPHTRHFFVLLLGIFGFFLLIRNCSIKNSELYVLSILFFLLLYTSSVFLYNLSDDMSFIRNIIFMIICYFAGYFTVEFYIYKFKDEAFYQFISLIFFIVFFQSLIMIANYFFPNIKNILDYILVFDNSTNIRVSGLASGGGDGLGLNMIAIILPLIVFKYINFTVNLKFIIFVIIIVFGTLLTARTGVVLFILLLLLLSIYKVFKIKSKYELIINVAKKIFLLLLLMIFFFVFIGDIINYFLEFITDGYSDPLVRFFEPLRRYALEGEFYTKSTSRLFGDMLFVPEKTATFIFGNGYLGREGGTYLHSDIGYIRLLFGIGLVGLFILFTFYFTLFYYSTISKYSLVMIALIVFGLLSNIKILYLPTLSYSYLIITIFLFLNKKKYKF